MKKARNELKDLRQFGIVLAAILGVFGAIHFFKHRVGLYPWFFSAGFLVLCAAIFLPRALRLVYAAFLKVAHALGWFNTRLILIFIYFVILTPISIIMKVFGKDMLHRKIDKHASSYWIKRESAIAAKDQLEKQF